MTAPLVSVIMPAHNARPYIGRAIDSVLAQTLAGVELVVVDDASCDGTGEFLAARAAGDPRIHSLRRETKGGPGVARNTAIAAARGEWVAMLDADDWYEPARLEKLIGAADREGVPLAVDNQRFVHAADGSWNETLVAVSAPPVQKMTADDLLRGDQLQRSSRNLGLLKPVIRRSFLQAHDIAYDSEITLGEDFYFLLKCLRHAPHIALVTEPLYNYRFYAPQSHSRNQTMAGFLALRTLHARYADLFDPRTAPSTAGLMEERRREIERYIRFKQLAEPLKRGDIAAFLAQARRDPQGLWQFIRRTATDPGGGFTHLRTLGRRIAGKAIERRRPHKTELGR